MLRLSILLLGCIGFCYGQNFTCAVYGFKMQPFFNVSGFVGDWHVISVLTPRTGEAARRYMDKNVKRHFTFDPSSGHLVIRTAVERQSRGCIDSVEEASPVPMSDFSKFTMVNQGSNERYGTSLWVLSTDNVGFAVIYSCDSVRGDGTCDPDKQVIYTMNRSVLGHTHGEMKHIEEAVRSVCVNPSVLVTMVQDGRCDGQSNGNGNSARMGWGRRRTPQEANNFWRNWVNRMGFGQFW